MDSVMRKLRFCPECRRELEIHPNSGNPACFLHGDFIIRDKGNGQFTITWERTNFSMRNKTN